MTIIWSWTIPTYSIWLYNCQILDIHKRSESTEKLKQNRTHLVLSNINFHLLIHVIFNHSTFFLSWCLFYHSISYASNCNTTISILTFRLFLCFSGYVFGFILIVDIFVCYCFCVEKYWKVVGEKKLIIKYWGC